MRKTMYMFEEVVCNIILVFTNLILIYMFDSLRIQTYTYALIKYYSISVKKKPFPKIFTVLVSKSK